jgi:hypothetical protein
MPHATAPGDSVSGPILRAFLALRGHPSLVAAYPIGMDPGVKLHYIDGTATTFDSRLTAPGPILPPDSVPHALFDSLSTTMLDSISGRIVGGHVDPDGQNGTCFVRISGDTFDALVEAVTILQRQPQVAYASWWGLFEPNNQSSRRPKDENYSGTNVYCCDAKTKTTVGDK